MKYRFNLALAMLLVLAALAFAPAATNSDEEWGHVDPVTRECVPGPGDTLTPPAPACLIITD